MITLLEGEKIALIKRRHWLVIAMEAVALFSVAALPCLGILMLYGFSEDAADFLQSYQAVVIFTGVAWLEALWMIFFIHWTNYYLDVLVVTNKRILDIEQIGLFSRDMAEIRLEHIQDIKVEVLGLIDSFLKMGNLHIQTAGQHKEIFLKNIPDVQEVKNMISRCCEELSKLGGVNQI